MARGKTDKAYTNFSLGFITEATGLSYPENSARDLDNVNLELNGTARRRLGLDSEIDASLVGAGYLANTSYSGLGGPNSISVTGTVVVPKEALAISAHIWRNPASMGDTNFIVFQIGNRLIIRNYDAETVSSLAEITALISGAVEFAYDDASTGMVYSTDKAQAAQLILQSSTGFGRIWFTHKGVVPFFLEYDPVTHIVTLNRVDCKGQYGTGVFLAIRDFNGVTDNLRVDEQPASLSTEHTYNLYNQGWASGDINSYQGDIGTYPSNAQQWILGKNPADNDTFHGQFLAKQDFGSGLAPRGRTVFDLLLGVKTATDRDGDPDIHIAAEDEVATASFSTTAFYAGRLWLAGDSNSVRPNGVYFSKILQAVEDAGVFLQVQDPTSEHFSDLLATDGGVIYIPEADHIERLEPFGVGLLVFARNGAWLIYGGDAGFSATQIAVDKVSSTGIISPYSVVRTQQLVAFWADNGIHALALPQQGVIPVLTDLTVDKIYKFYNKIARVAREQSSGSFDPISKKIFWSYLDAETYTYPTNQRVYNRMLILDTRTGAFSKYSFTNSNSPFFTPSVTFPRHSISEAVNFDNPVLDNDDEIMVGDESVVLGVSSAMPDDFFESLKVVLLDGNNAALQIAEFNNVTFYDYGSYVIGATDYNSFVIAFDETLGDLQRNKSATYVHSFFKRTETGFDDNVNPIRESACLLRGHWDWHTNSAGHRWTAAQNAYRYRRPYTPSGPGDPYETGDSVVYTRLKMRGRGHALALEYHSVPGKDFQLLGWSTAFTANGV